MANIDRPIRLVIPAYLDAETLHSFNSQNLQFIRILSRQRTGFSNPQWKVQVKAGANATTQLSGVFDSIEQLESGSFILHDYWASDGEMVQRYKFTGLRPNSVTFAGTSSSSVTADNLALKLLYRRIQDRRTSFQGGVFLGEIGESLRMLTSPAKALREGLNSYLSSVRKNARGSRKAKRAVIADTWLEYSFGWLPLVYDIKEAADAYIKHKEKLLTNRLTSRGSESSSVVDYVDVPGAEAGNVPLRTSRKTVSTVSVQYIVGLRFAGSGASPDVTAFERAGLTLSQFVPTLWELIPYSFLVDYFTNIGDIINAGATNTSDVIWVCKTVRSESVVTQTDTPDYSQSNDSPAIRRTITGTPSLYVAKRKAIQRTVPVLGYPRFEVSFPGRPTQWMNMAALGVSARRLSSSF